MSPRVARKLALALVLALGSAPLSAAPAATAAGARHARLLLSIGSNVGLEHEDALAHAVDDANRMAALLGELGGVAPGATHVLADPSVTDVLQAVRALGSQAAAVEAVFVYVSAHGDEEALHLAGARLPLADLQRAVAELPAPLKVIVIDACRSAGTVDKGVTAAPTFTVTLPPTALHHEGVVTVLASGRGEAAQESARLGGGVFTHFLLSALRGAADRDGDRRVTLAEAYDFAYGRTLARSVAATGAPQHPELVLALQGSGPLVVTELDPARSRLALPPGADTHYFVYAKGSGAVLAEAWGRPDRPTTLALPAGRLVIQRQRAGANSVTEVALPYDGQVDLEANAFVAVTREPMAARGGATATAVAVAPWPNSVGVAGGATSDRQLNLGPALSIWYGRESGALVMQLGLGLGSLDRETAYNAARSTRYEAIGSAGRQWMGPRFTFHALADLALRVEHQHLRDVSAVVPAPYDPAEDDGYAMAAGVGARAGVAWILDARIAVLAEVSARAFGVRERGATSETHLAIEPDFGLRLGLTRSF